MELEPAVELALAWLSRVPKQLQDPKLQDDDYLLELYGYDLHQYISVLEEFYPAASLELKTQIKSIFTNLSNSYEFNQFEIGIPIFKE